MDTTKKATAELELKDISSRFGLAGEIDWRDRRKRVAIMVSKSDHCLWEILLRQKAHELDCDIPLVISNHPDLEPVANTFGIPYQVLPVTPETKSQQEQQELSLLRENEIDVIVLARYMQVLSDDFLRAYEHKIINIHHSFLPAFRGGKAYHQAHARGVKLIGATVRLCLRF
jgi:formyltetrahydrofolate deformylase